MPGNSSRRVTVVGDTPESVILSVLLAESGLPNDLVGSYAAPTGQSVLGNGVEEANWLLEIHSKSGMVNRCQAVDEAQTSDSQIVILTDHAQGSTENGAVERRARQLAPVLTNGQVLLYTGLCPPSYTRNSLKKMVEKFSGLRVGESLGLCYLPLLWNGESLGKFRETPKVIVGEGVEHLERAQEVLFSIFPSLSVAPSFETAETAGLLGPAYREVVRALELELAEMCIARRVDYSNVAKLCSNTGVPILGLPNTVNGRDPIASGILLDVLGNRNRPMLVRTARRINDEAPQQVLAMVKGALARCGRGVRRARIAILGLDVLGLDPALGLEGSEVISTLVRRGAVVSVYPAGRSINLPANGERGIKVRVEPDLSRAIQKAQCAIIALKPSQREAVELNPQKLAAEMDRPAAICDLSRVLEASNVERSGLFYTSIGRGCANS